MRQTWTDTDKEQPPTVDPLEALTLEQVVAVFKRWLLLKDDSIIYATLGAVAANLLGGDPVWLLVVGAPGSGKTEVVQAGSGHPDARASGTLTVASLLSGTAKKERAKGARGGLLKEIGEFGIIILKDFGSVLNLQRDARAELLAALREVYDGSYTRHVGTEGGRTLEWSGKAVFIGGCTEDIDRHAAVMGTMGERFLLFRAHALSKRELAKRAIRNRGQEAEMRSELQRAVQGLFTTPLVEPPPLADADLEWLLTLAEFVAEARSAVVRDGYKQEIDLIPEAEVPTRIAKQLATLLGGMVALGATRRRALEVVRYVALSCLTAKRLAVLTALRELGGDDWTGSSNTTAVSERSTSPTNTVRRTLEDLAAHGTVLRESQGQGKADLWSLSPHIAKWWREIETLPGTEEETSPEMSVVVKTPPGTSPENVGSGEDTPQSCPNSL